MKILKLVFLIMPVSIFMAFMIAPPAKILGEASRIIYFHVPLAMGSVIAFTYSGIASIIFLLDKNKKYQMLDVKSHNSAQIGVLYTVLAIISGSIWAKISWGSYWNWDPRQTTITVMMLIYIAYFCLWTALENNENRGKICSAYLIFTLITIPFFVFIIPRVYQSQTLHPDTIINTRGKMEMAPMMRISLFVAMAAFTFLYAYLLSLMNKLSKINNIYQEKYDEK